MDCFSRESNNNNNNDDEPSYSYSSYSSSSSSSDNFRRDIADSGRVVSSFYAAPRFQSRRGEGVVEAETPDRDTHVTTATTAPSSAPSSAPPAPAPVAVAVAAAVAIVAAAEEDTAYLCVECGASFPDKAGLDRHLSVWSSELQPLACYVCQLSFGCLWALKRHVEEHDGGGGRKGGGRAGGFHDKSLMAALGCPPVRNSRSCGTCRRVFAKASDLQLHEESAHHAKGRAWSQRCHVCGKSFSSGRSLWQHRLIHLPARAAASGKRQHVEVVGGGGGGEGNHTTLYIFFSFGA